jgi:serine protease Do
MNWKHHISHFLIALMAAIGGALITLHYVSKSLANSPITPLFSETAPIVKYTGNANVVHTVKVLGPAVVSINTVSIVQPLFPNDMNQFFQQFFGDNPFPFSQPYKSEGAGSGVIISKSGLVVTNEHVIHKATSIMVTLTNNQQFQAKVVGSDQLSDIAVLQIEHPPKNLPVAILGDSSHLQIGEWVVAIGNPYGFQNTVTVGVLSALGRKIAGENHEYEDLLQTDAAINPGNSGGPLADLSGAVIGINTAIIPYAQGIGFAIPINTVKRVATELIETGHMRWPFLGVSMSYLTPQIAKYLRCPVENGVVVVKVIPGSPAAKIGLKQGDVIVALDGKKVSNPDDLSEAVRQHHVGDKVQVEFYRDGKLFSKNATLAERPQ